MSRQIKAKWVLFFGFFMVFAGVAPEIIVRIVISQPLSDGIRFGATAMTISGLAVTMIARCLQALEHRLDKIEGAK